MEATTMIEHETLLVTLVKLGRRIPVPPRPATRGRGRPRTYPDRLLLQALVILIVRPLHPVHALLRVLAQLTAEMHTWRGLLTMDRRFPPGAPGSGGFKPSRRRCRADRLSRPGAEMVDPAIAQVRACRRPR
jgi:hypothetical protein